MTLVSVDLKFMLIMIKGNFLMLMLGFKLMILGFWLTLPPSYAIGYYFKLIMKNISYIKI
jgi:mannitol-specific phosphotransferase system IIBC component